ncbi:M60 family metallopeptidase [Chitinimonas sp.]|uniref:M60 family metallopeptidase n=1 Tax=Chitinimonas sp. TaxID=1934313 RepID=UPI0035B0CDA7
MSPTPVPPAESFVANAESDLGRLLRGLSVAPGTKEGIPGGIRISSERVFPVANGGRDYSLAVGARLGNGRLFLYGASNLRDAFGTPTADDHHTLLDNVLGWLTVQNGNLYDKALAGGAKLPILTKDLPVAKVDPRFPVAFTKVDKYTAALLDPAKYPVVYLNFRLDQAETDLLESYIRRGGAVFTSRSYWALQSYPWDEFAKAVAPRDVRYTDYPLVNLLQKIGMELVTWGDPNSTTIHNANELKLQYAPAALDYWTQYRSGKIALASIPGLAGLASDAEREIALNKAAFSLFRTNPDHPAVVALFNSAQANMKAGLVGSAKGQFNCKDPSGAKDPADNTRDRISMECEVLRQHYENLSLKPGQAADPTASHFPGAMSGSARAGRVSINVDTSTDNPWTSTGLYAPPGETITVTVPKGVDVDLQIGGHNDSTGHHTTWLRPARIAQSVHLHEGENQLSSPFGGLIYVRKAWTAGKFSLDIEGAGRAAYFKLGSNSDADWNAQLKTATAPWAEIEGERVIITLPMSVASTVNQPTAVIKRWDAMRVEYDKISGEDFSLPEPNNPGSRKERYMPDIDIGGGYMHSGYPIMTFTDVPPNWVKLDGRPFPGGWGEWHEMGHNHQGAFGWDGLGEVTNNIHSMNIERQVRTDGKDNLDGKNGGTWAKIDAYFKDPNRDYDSNPDVFLKLGMFWQLNLAFRDQDFYPKVYRAFREIGKAGYLKDETRPSDSDGKKQQFLYAASLISGYNLLGFFDTWGMKANAATIARINGLKLPQPPFDLSRCRNGSCPK